MLLMIEAAFMGVALGVCYIYGEYDDAICFIWSILTTLGAGGAMILIPRKSQGNDMGKREGILLTGLTWVIFSVFGMLPFIWGSPKLDVASAYFETMSGFTTTGVTTISAVESVSHGILMWRAITHLLGGMGIILFTLAVIPMLNKQSGIQLFNAEVTGITHDKVRPRISHTAKSLWMVYIVLSVTLIILLWLGPMNLFDAICHSFSTISTGGFSTKNASIEYYNSDYLKIVLSIFMLISGANFALLYKFAIGDRKALLKNDTTRWYLTIVAIAILIIGLKFILSGNYSTYVELAIDTTFQVIAAITTTGFTGSDYTSWTGLPIIVILFIMVLGSCAGSTTGGVKVDRFIVIVKNMRNELYKLLHPNTITTIRVNGKVLSYDLISKTGAFMSAYTVLAILGVTILEETGMTFFDSMFASISCLSNIGLGYGISGNSFADICATSKWTLSALMLAGRLEIFTILITFTKHFWNKE